VPKIIETLKDPQLILETLSNVSLFSGLVDPDMLDLFDVCELIEYEADEVIFHQGDPSTGLFILISGRVDISQNKKGTINTLRPCDVIGEIGLLCQVHRTATASCITDSVLLHIKRQDLNHLMGRYPNIYAMIMKNMAASLSERVIGLTHTKAIREEGGNKVDPPPHCTTF
jgi:CRP-like cAMP-binding protein